MGREIRKVPKGWEHPRNDKGEYQPAYDRTFKEAAAEWVKEFLLWHEGKHPDQIKKRTTDSTYYWQWAGDPPCEEYHRPEFKGKPDCFQVYETVTEGTPTSPVFESKKEMTTWLIKQGYSEESAKAFIEDEWAPSMIVTMGSGGADIKMGIDSCGSLKKK